MEKTVEIIIKDSIVRQVKCPEGVRVVIRDFDAWGVNGDRIEKDDEGHEYIETVWE